MTSPIFGQVLPNLGVKLTSVYYLFCLFPGVFIKRLQYCEDLDECFDVKLRGGGSSSPDIIHMVIDLITTKNTQTGS